MKAELKKSEIAGLGAFACEAYDEGDVVLIIDDSRVVNDSHPLDPDKGEEIDHCDWLGDTVVLMQSPERYINHSCSPNTFVQTRDGLRHVIALRKISEGEELTYDYRINGIGEDYWSCGCHSAACGGRICADFFKLSLAEQLEYFPLLDTWFLELYAAKLEGLRKLRGEQAPFDKLRASRAGRVSKGSRVK